MKLQACNEEHMPRPGDMVWVRVRPSFAGILVQYWIDEEWDMLPHSLNLPLVIYNGVLFARFTFESHQCEGDFCVEEIDDNRDKKIIYRGNLFIDLDEQRKC